MLLNALHRLSNCQYQTDGVSDTDNAVDRVVSKYKSTCRANNIRYKSTSQSHTNSIFKILGWYEGSSLEYSLQERNYGIYMS